MKLRPQVLFTFSHTAQIPRRRQMVTYSKVVLTPPKYLQGLYIYYVIAKGGKGVWRTPIFDYIIHCNTKLLQKFLARICHILVISHQTVPTIFKISNNWEKSPRIGEISKNKRNLQELGKAPRIRDFCKIITKFWRSHFLCLNFELIYNFWQFSQESTFLGNLVENLQFLEISFILSFFVIFFLKNVKNILSNSWKF